MVVKKWIIENYEQFKGTKLIGASVGLLDGKDLPLVDTDSYACGSSTYALCKINGESVGSRHF